MPWYVLSFISATPNVAGNATANVYTPLEIIFQAKLYF